MNQQFGQQAFVQAEKLFKEARIPENVQAIAQQSVAATQEIYTKTAAAAQDTVPNAPRALILVLIPSDPTSVYRM
jgi:hypothetical protein